MWSTLEASQTEKQFDIIKPLKSESERNRRLSALMNYSPGKYKKRRIKKE